MAIPNTVKVTIQVHATCYLCGWTYTRSSHVGMTPSVRVEAYDHVSKAHPGADPNLVFPHPEAGDFSPGLSLTEVVSELEEVAAQCQA